MPDKVFVCRCEDVTLADLDRALATGFRTLEEVKRYTGFGTGPCQGRECHALLASLLARRTGDTPVPFTSRPPLRATRLDVLASGGSEET